MDIVEAQRFMGENDIRHLPIVGDGKRLLGLVTRQSLLVDPGRLGSLNIWEITRYLTGLSVKDVMVKAEDVVTVEQDTTIEEAARIMVEKRIGCLPVLEEGVVVGIITYTDLLAHLSTLLGWPFSGVRVTMRMPDRVGEFAKVTKALASQGGGIYGAGGAPAPKHSGYWDGVFKVRGVSRDDLVAELAKIEGQEIVDVREM